MAKLKFISREEAFRAGNELALWDEVLEHLDALPPWARTALLSYAKTTLLPGAKTKTGKGRHARALEEQKQIWEDFRVFEAVNHWQEQSLRYKSGRTKSFSQRLARECISEEMHGSPEAIYAAYNRAKRRNAQGFYVSERFLRTITIDLV